MHRVFPHISPPYFSPMKSFVPRQPVLAFPLSFSGYTRQIIFVAPPLRPSGLPPVSSADPRQKPARSPRMLISQPFSRAPRAFFQAFPALPRLSRRSGPPRPPEYPAPPAAFVPSAAAYLSGKGPKAARCSRRTPLKTAPFRASLRWPFPPGRRCTLPCRRCKNCTAARRPVR